MSFRFWPTDRRRGRGDRRQVYSRNADGSGAAELILDEPEQIQDVRVSNDGRWAVFRTGGGGISDLYARRLDESGERIPLVVTHEQKVVGILSSFDLLKLVEGHRFVAKAGPTRSQRKGSHRS